MPDRLYNGIEWWQHACQETPYAIAFISTDNKFLWVNKAWTILTGYTSASLVGRKRWQDITDPEDIGPDQIETEEILHGKDNEYYCEKTYIRADNTKVNVGIYVHRHPPFGPQDGFVVFARPTASDEFVQLTAAYKEIEREVSLLNEARRGWKEIECRVSQLEKTTTQQLAAIQDTLNVLISRNPISPGVTIGGGFTGGDSTGRDKNNPIVLIAALVAVVGLAALLFGGYLALTSQGVQIGR